jgi:guanylate kinase
VEFSVSYTTRKKRKTEKEGKDYFFISEEEFKRLIQEEKLVEWAVVHENYYGTSKRELEKKTGADLLLDIDVQGAAKIKEKVKKAVFVFILPPMFGELKKRLEARGQEHKESIIRRLEVAKREIRHYNQFDYIIINDRLDKAAEELKAVILSHRCRIEIRKKAILPILRSFSGED